MKPQYPLTILFALLTAVSAQDTSGTASNSTEPTRSLIKFENTEFEISIWGKGDETILALPGNGADTTWYQFIAPRIAAAGYQFVAMNPREIGDSRGSIENLSVKVMASDVASVIKELKAEKVHLIGWAFGNRIARATAASYPDQVETVTLLAAGGLVAPSKAARDANTQVISSKNLSKERQVELYKASIFSPASDVMAILKSVPSKTWPEARAAQTAAMSKADRSDWLSGGDVNMLVVQGLDDKMAVPANGYALKKEFPERVTLADIFNAGHMLLVERPNEIAEKVISFLEANPIASGVKSE